jgi:Mrp family chromosome partitioning ATPase
MRRLHRRLRGEGDFVVLAASPPLVAADAMAVSSLADCAVVVVSPRRTRAKDLGTVRSRLERMAVPVIGAVLHGWTPADGAPEPDAAPSEPRSLPAAAGADEDSPVPVGAPQ